MYQGLFVLYVIMNYLPPYFTKTLGQLTLGSMPHIVIFFFFACYPTQKVGIMSKEKMSKMF